MAIQSAAPAVLGSSCIYPKFAEQPIKEEVLLTGPWSPPMSGMRIAKIGIKLCEALRQQYGFDAISLMPTNLYGPGDNYHPDNSHVLPALIRRFHEAAQHRTQPSPAGVLARPYASSFMPTTSVRPVSSRFNSFNQGRRIPFPQRGHGH